ncbi:TetR/AcrR family transcriptional regulator C-terminal ligand-binding domain-containing protein [Brucella sp. BE17]|uniref:TetR/AcrR family transcriptional regulator n=1 Tax=Brucella sp. BE17 TaxID=3142977 RepID=UPI0031BAFC61
MTTRSFSRRSIGPRRNPDTAAAILDAAADLLRRDGLKGLTTDAVAREARASKATLYRWWPNRGTLLLAVYQRLKDGHLDADTGSLTGDLRQTLRNLFAFWRGEGHVFALIIAEAQHDSAVAEVLADYRQERITAWEQVLHRASGRGEIILATNLNALAESILAHAWLYLMTGRLDADPDMLADRILKPFQLD